MLFTHSNCVYHKKKHGFHHQDAGWIDRFHGVDVEISAVHV